MKTMILVTTMALATTGCAPAMMVMATRGNPAMPFIGQPTAPVEPAPIGRWDNVMRLPRGSGVDVLTVNGAANVGQIVDADNDTVRVDMDGAVLRVARADVVRVDLVDLAGSEARAVAREVARGALLGAGVVALVAGVIGPGAWPPPGEWLRAGAAVGGVTAGQAETRRRAGRLIYLAPGARTSNSGNVGDPAPGRRAARRCFSSPRPTRTALFR